MRGKDAFSKRNIHKVSILYFVMYFNIDLF